MSDYGDTPEQGPSGDARTTAPSAARRGKGKAKEPKPNVNRLALVAEPFATANKTRFQCQECGLAARCKTQFLNAYVPKDYTGKLLVVTGTRPDEETVKRLRRYAAPHFQGNDIAFVGAVRCHPLGDFPPDKPPAMKQIRACRPYFLRALEVLRPEHVLAMGKAAYRTVTNEGGKPNIIEYRGYRLAIPGTERWAYLTFDAAYDPAREEYVRQDFYRFTWPRLTHPEDLQPRVTRAVACDTEFDRHGTLTDVAAANSGASFVQTGGDAASLARVLGVLDNARTLVGHAVMCEVDGLVKLGRAKPGWVSGADTLDSLLLARMSDENRGKGGYGVETLLLSGHNVEPWKFVTEEYSVDDSSKWPAELRAERCRLDAWASAVLVKDYLGTAKGPIEVMHRQAASLHRLHHVGAYIDLEKFAEFSSELAFETTKYAEILTRAAASVGMAEFVPTNDGHVRELLFDRLKLPPGEYTDTGEHKIDKTTLKQHKDNDVIDALMRYNAAEKLYSVNVKGFNEYLQRVVTPWGTAGFVPVRVNPFGARTGRRSSNDPNWQNWKKKMRTMVRSRWKDGLIGDHDYSRLEVILMAYFAKDAKLFDYFHTGDGYIGVGKELWNKEVVKDTDEYRVTKSIVLGVQYGMRGYKLGMQLWNNVGIQLHPNQERHIELADELRTKYLDKFPGVKRFMAERRRELLSTQQVRSVTGVVRRLPCPDGEDTPGFGHLINEAVNFPIQHFASMVTGCALVDVESALCAEHGISLTEYHKAVLEKRWPEMAMVWNEVHDDLPVDFFPGTFKRDQEIVVETMRNVPTLRKLVPEFDIPLKVGVEVSTRWCGDKLAA